MICYDLLWSVMICFDLWHVMTCYDMLWPSGNLRVAVEATWVLSSRWTFDLMWNGLFLGLWRLWGWVKFFYEYHMTRIITYNHHPQNPSYDFLGTVCFWPIAPGLHQNSLQSTWKPLRYRDDIKLYKTHVLAISHQLDFRYQQIMSI